MSARAMAHVAIQDHHVATVHKVAAILQPEVELATFE